MVYAAVVSNACIGGDVFETRRQSCFSCKTVVVVGVSSGCCSLICISFSDFVVDTRERDGSIVAWSGHREVSPCSRLDEGLFS